MLNFLSSVWAGLKEIFSFQSTRGKSVSGGKMNNNKKGTKETREYLFKVSLALFTLLFISFLYPLESLYPPINLPQEGQIAPEDIIAPFTFPILKEKGELEKEKKIALANLPLLLEIDRTKNDSSFKKANSFFEKIDSLNKAASEGSALGRKDSRSREKKLSLVLPDLSPSVINLLAQDEVFFKLERFTSQILSEIYKVGLLEDWKSSEGEEPNSFIILDSVSALGGKEVLIPKEKILTLSKAEEKILILASRSFPDNPDFSQATYDIINQFLFPNLRPNLEQTSKRKESLLSSISPYKGIVLKGEKIIEKGKEVTKNDLGKVASLTSHEIKWTNKESRSDFIFMILTRLIFVGSIFLILVILLYLFKKEILKDNSKLLLLVILILSEVFIAYLLAFHWHLSEYLIPTALVSLLLTVLLGVEVGLFSTLTLSLLLGLLLHYDFNLSLISLVAGSVACFSVRKVTARYKFYRPTIYISFAYVIMIYLLESLKFTPISKTIEYCGFGIFNGFFSVVLTMGLLPIFESIFSVTTDFSLLELSDLNHPLLKRLALMAPGTYHHSIVVGNLVEAAAKALKANTLLARVGAYYHDIGKMEKPEYFVENQMGFKSKHEKLVPSMSALILESHVKEGAEMGKKGKLPKKIIDLIQEHHGTTVMTYFYDKALKQGASPEVMDEFRYPGPKPRSKEAGILMLADALEAASRTLDEPKPSRIISLTRKIITDKFEAGELDDCDLTLKDLHAIEESFLPILIGVFHPRVDYPEAVEET
jgi:putative nucleotidyltransferase with HDIG domain